MTRRLCPTGPPHTHFSFICVLNRQELQARPTGSEWVFRKGPSEGAFLLD